MAAPGDPQPPAFPAVPFLVGRERERAVLGDHLTAARAGQGSLVLIGGEAGIGKTALAETLTREAAAQGARVLIGRCYDLSETPPYGPWVELFDTYTPDTDLPALPAAFAQRGTVGAVESQAALLTAARDFFTVLATHGPLLLVLDDLHWADPASLDLLRFLARTVTRLPLLVLVAYRVDELTRRHPLYHLLPVLERESGGTRLDLRRLSPAAVQSLVAARYGLPATDADRLVGYLHARAEGNAFFTVQLLRALEEGDVLRSDDERGWVVGDLARVHVPLALRQVIDGRLARLSEEAQRLLGVAAVIGQEVPLALWAAVTESDEEKLLELVEQAMVARLVEETEDGTRVRFVHALIREALYEGISSVRRRRLHERVGEVLITTPSPDPDAVVYHFRRAGDMRLVDWLIKAAERALRAYAAKSTIAHYEEALPLLPASAPSPARYGALIQLAALHRLQLDGVAYAEEALQTARSLEDPLLEAVALTRLGTNRTYVESIPEGLMEQERAVAMLSALPGSETHWFMEYSARLAQIRDRRQIRDRLAVARGFLALTHAIVGRFADIDAESDFGGYNGWDSLVIRDAAFGHPEAARAHLQQVLARARVAGDNANLGTALVFDLAYVVIPYYADDAAEVHRVAEAAVSAWAQVSDEMLGMPPRSMGLEALFLLGEWDEAWSLFLTMRRSPRAVFGETSGAPVRLIRERGETDLAWTLVREMFPADPATEPGSIPFRRSLALQETAVALSLDRGDVVSAKEWLEAHDRWLAWNGTVLGQSEGQALWAQYYRQTEDAAKAHEHAERALAHATDPRQPLALLAAHRLLGELDTDARRFADAQMHFDASLALAEACQAPYERALTLLALAEVHVANGEPESAQTLLDEVRAVCTRLGAKPALARVDALAARLSPTPAPAYPAGLSAREVEVLRLVATGLTNPQVAARLFISVRTVEQHLRSIYNKLGIATRNAATRFAFEHDLASVTPIAPT